MVGTPLEKGSLRHYAKCETEGWICREWDLSLALSSCVEYDQKRLNLMRRYCNSLNPKIKVSYTAATVKICQKKHLHRTLEEFKGFKAAQNIVAGIVKFMEIKLVHGDLCASNIGFGKKGELLVFDWEPFLKTQPPNLRWVELRTSKFALHPNDGSEGRITTRSDLFAVGALLLQALHGRYRGLKLCQIHQNSIANIAEHTAHPAATAEALLNFANEIKVKK